MQNRFLILIFLCLLGSASYALVRITNMQDFDFGTAPFPFVTLQQQKDICVYNNVNRRIWVTATGLHDAGNNFRLANGSSFIIYQVRISQPGGNNFRRLRPGVRRGRQAQITNQTCAGARAPFSKLRITIPVSSFNNPLPTGSYTDTLSILIEPR